MKPQASVMPSIAKLFNNDMQLFNNDMQYLVECSEKIVRDNPKS